MNRNEQPIPVAPVVEPSPDDDEIVFSRAAAAPVGVSRRGSDWVRTFYFRCGGGGGRAVEIVKEEGFQSKRIRIIQTRPGHKDEVIIWCGGSEEEALRNLLNAPRERKSR
jgi:hypothetical protein